MQDCFRISELFPDLCFAKKSFMDFCFLLEAELACGSLALPLLSLPVGTEEFFVDFSMWLETKGAGVLCMTVAV